MNTPNRNPQPPRNAYILLDEGEASAGVVETPAPEKKAAPEPETGVRLTKAEYDALKASADKAAAAETEVASLRQVREHARRLLQTDTSPEAQKESLRAMMSDAGWTTEATEKYIKEQFPEKGSKGRRSEESDEEGDNRVAELEARLARAEEETAGNTRTRLERDLETKISDEVDRHPEMGKLYKRLSELSEDGEGGASDGLKTSLREAVKRETLDRLRQRRATESRRVGRDVWDDRWLAEESKKAAEEVAKDRISYIPEPSKLGRTPSVDPWKAELDNQKPVAPPKFDAKTDPEDLRAQNHNWAVDSLLRVAADADNGGKTKA